jgi:hypothetical protein
VRMTGEKMCSREKVKNKIGDITAAFLIDLSSKSVRINALCSYLFVFVCFSIRNSGLCSECYCVWGFIFDY